MKKITDNFSLEEFLHSDTAITNKINNTPTPEAIASIEHLCINLLEPLRNRFNESITINSGYRSAALNTKIGGRSMSQHLRGEAADCSVSSPLALWNTLKASKLTFDQAILYNTFLHLSLKKSGNRNQFINNRKK